MRITWACGNRLWRCSMNRAKGRRKYLLTVYWRRYKPLDYAAPWRCFYCSDTSDTVDHCPALANVYSRGIEHFREFLLVPCCHDCNSLAGNRAPDSLYERGQFIAKKIVVRYRAMAKRALWSEEELAELEYRTRHAFGWHSLSGEWARHKIKYVTERWLSDLAPSAEAQKPAQKFCKWCNGKFKAKSSKNMFCGRRCQRAHRNSV